MNLEVGGTKKVILVEDSQGLTLNTDSQKFTVAIAGVTGSSGSILVTSPLINSGTLTNAQLSISIGNTGGTVAAGDDSRIVGSVQKSENLSDLISIAEAKMNLGLDNVNNTTDLNKPVSTATQTALNAKLNTSVAASTYTPLSDARLTNQRTPVDGSVTDAKIVSGGLAPASIAGTAVITTDGRLGNARTPVAHKSSHATGAIDALSPADIGAATSGHTHTELDNNLSMHGNKVTNLGAATDPEDAVNKQYVDRVAVGLNVHPSVKYTTTDTITLSGLTNQSGKIDSSEPLTAGDRILVKDQAISGNAKGNGIYVAASGSWSRASDMTGTGIVNWRSGVVGAYIFVDNGATLNGSSWFANVTNVGTESIGTDSINFNKFASVNLTEGNGIRLFAGAISIKLATSNPGLDITNGLMIVANPTNPTITIGSAGLSVNYNSAKALTATSSGLEIKTSSGISIDPTNGIYINTGAITNAMLNGGIDLTSKVTNALPIANGGTGATSQSSARTNLGLGNSAVLDTGTSAGTVATGNHTHTFKTTQTFAIQGNIITSSGLKIPPVFFAKSTNQTSTLVDIIYQVETGTVNFWIEKNDGQILPLTSGNTLQATSTKQLASSTITVNTTMSDADKLALWINGIGGSPKNLTVTLVFQHIITGS